MRLDVLLNVDSLRDVPAAARDAERLGFDTVWVPEINHNPFLPLALAAMHTKRVKLGTAVALAFTRSPMVLAYESWDLQKLSGRFTLGLGTQVKGHIERRFGVKWESPSARMKEVILALKAIWKTWQTGVKLDFRGRFYTLNLMTPFFSPGAVSHPHIPIFIAAVNRHMCRLAGEVCDGIHIHPLHTRRYIEEVIIPNLNIGISNARRERKDLEISASVFVAMGEDDRTIEDVKKFIRSQVSFYASTRTYRPVMDIHGWGEIAHRLHEESVKGEWDKMPNRISDDMLREFMVEGTHEEIPSLLKKRYSSLLDRITVHSPFAKADKGWEKVVEGFGVNH